MAVLTTFAIQRHKTAVNASVLTCRHLPVRCLPSGMMVVHLRSDRQLSVDHELCIYLNSIWRLMKRLAFYAASPRLWSSMAELSRQELAESKMAEGIRFSSYQKVDIFFSKGSTHSRVSQRYIGAPLKIPGSSASGQRTGIRKFWWN